MSQKQKTLLPEKFRGFQGYSDRPKSFLLNLRWKLRYNAVTLRNLALTCVGMVPTRGIRKYMYKAFGMKIDDRVKIAPHLQILGGPSRISIGEGSIINREVIIDGRFPVTIGKNVSISIQTIIMSLDHDVYSSDFRGAGAPVMIGDRAFIGTRAMIMPGVTIGEGAVVAAGAVVTKDVAPFQIVAGVPAKPIGCRPENLTYNL